MNRPGSISGPNSEANTPRIAWAGSRSCDACNARWVVRSAASGRARPPARAEPTRNGSWKTRPSGDSR